MAQSLLIPLIALSLSIISLSANCQRCGGNLIFRIYDKKGKVLCPSIKDLIHVYDESGIQIYRNFNNISTDYQNMRVVFFKTKNNSIQGDQNYSSPFFYKPTGCILSLWHITVKKGSKVMDIDFKNMPMEMTCLVDSIVFKPGKYSIDWASPKGAIFQPSPNSIPYGWQPDCIIPAQLNLKKK